MSSILCCDLGGTTADWAVYNADTREQLFVRPFEVEKSEDFYAMLDTVLVEARRSLAGHDLNICHTTIGVCGPIGSEKAIPTNIQGWEVRKSTVSSILEEHGHRPDLTLINDFEALGYGILYLNQNGFGENDISPIYGRFRTGPRRIGEFAGHRSLVCGPGTGLGVACLIEGLEHYKAPFVLSSEAGHMSFAPETAEQHRFLTRGGSSFEKISYESALSHSGLREIYNFYRQEDHREAPNYGISSREIVALSQGRGDQAAIDAVDLFCEILAGFCGNMVLAMNCDRAVFLWGGAMRLLPPDLLKTRFQRLYGARCNLSERVANTPVVMLRNKNIPLLGGMAMALAAMNQEAVGGP
jgi:glucokinase